MRRIYASTLCCCVALGVESFSSLPPQQPQWRHLLPFQQRTPTIPSSSANNNVFLAVPWTAATSATSLRSARTFSRRRAKSQGVTSSNPKERSIEIDPFSEYPLTNPSSKTSTSTSSPFDRYPCLVLNADYQPLSYMPLSLWSWQDAIKSIFLGKVTVVDVYPEMAVRAVNVEFPLPSVIAVTDYVPTPRSTPAFTRHNVLLRDEYRCQYCHERFPAPDLSLDHVVPRCHGGHLSWTNAVACCRHCNGRKGCKSIQEIQKELNMTLLKKPVVPTQYELTKIAARLMTPRRVHTTWKPYLRRTE
jgi:5-methylcytosine-specific restriction endonuclease McrA